MINYELALHLLSVAKCPNCDGSGAIGHVVPRGCMDEEGNCHFYDDVEWEQCQWCFEKNLLLG